MAKLIGQSGEGAKVKLRQIRKSAVSEAKQLASEDDQKRAEKQVGGLLVARCKPALFLLACLPSGCRSMQKLKQHEKLLAGTAAY